MENVFIGSLVSIHMAVRQHHRFRCYNDPIIDIPHTLLFIYTIDITYYTQYEKKGFN